MEHPTQETFQGARSHQSTGNYRHVTQAMLGLVIETVENYLLPIGPTVGALRSHGIAASGKFPGPAPFWLTFQRHGTGPAARVAAG